jgi:hypothetical protein
MPVCQVPWPWPIPLSDCVPATIITRTSSLILGHIIPSIVCAYLYHRSHMRRWKQILLHGIEIISCSNQSSANRLWMGIYYCS